MRCHRDFCDNQSSVLKPTKRSFFNLLVTAVSQVLFVWCRTIKKGQPFCFLWSQALKEQTGGSLPCRSWKVKWLHMNTTAMYYRYKWPFLAHQGSGKCSQTYNELHTHFTSYCSIYFDQELTLAYNCNCWHTSTWGCSWFMSGTLGIFIIFNTPLQ